MGNNLTRLQSGGFAGGDRRTARELARLDAAGQLEFARVNQAADLQAERVAAVGYVGKVALREVALLSQAEQHLALVAPAASGRLQYIADSTALALAEIVSETTRRVK